jgi:hypothetical protein
MLQVVGNKDGGRGTRTPKGLRPPHFECPAAPPEKLHDVGRTPAHSPRNGYSAALFSPVRSDNTSDSAA